MNCCALTFAASLAATTPLGITVLPMREAGPAVRIELRNSSDHPLESRMTLWFHLFPPMAAQEPRCRRGGVTLFDPETETSYQLRQPDTPSPRLRLPPRGSLSFTANLAEMRWSIPSALDVGTTYELWEIAECTEYDLVVSVSLDEYSPVQSQPLRIRVRPDETP